MLHLNSKSYKEKSVPVREIYNKYKHTVKNPIPVARFHKIITCYGRHALNYVYSTGNSLFFPELGEFCFKEREVEEVFERRDRPNIDYKAYYKYMQENDIEPNKIDKSLFYTEDSEILPRWFKILPKSLYSKVKMTSYKVMFKRDFKRTISKLVRNKELTLDRL